jgi:flagellar biosynthesis component FlhA
MLWPYSATALDNNQVDVKAVRTSIMVASLVVNIMLDIPSELVDVSMTSYLFCSLLLTDLGSTP